MEDSVAIRLKNIRELKGFTQRQLAEKAGMGEVQIQMYEYGTRKPKAAALQKLAFALEVDVAFLQPSKLITKNSILAILYDFVDKYGDITFANRGITTMFGVDNDKRTSSLNLLLAEAMRQHEKLSVEDFKKWLVEYEGTRRRPIRP